MKRYLVVISMLLGILMISGCSIERIEAASEPSITPQTTDNVSTATSIPIDDTVYIESDALPDFWQGEWICTYAEYYFLTDEIIFVKDFDNAVLYTTLAGGEPWDINRWFVYNEEAQTIDIYNEPAPYPEQYSRITFEIKRASEDEIVMTRKTVGQEVRFARLEEE